MLAGIIYKNFLSYLTFEIVSDVRVDIKYFKYGEMTKTIKDNVFKEL